ncbi:MAG: DUF2961 domain-containing protein [Acidobacteriota bacterium]|nr:DUF2961 domain-containing protein [Acidobacteriota bacterium]
MLLAAMVALINQPAEDLARIRTDLDTRFSNAGWTLDRYTDLPTLDAGASMVLADLRGPGIIRHIHTTRHHPADLFARGIVIEITFDGAEEPAVSCPLADFFGDGCNGRSREFSTPLIECAPWSYNCYFPMPFRESARVVLRNDTARNALNYSYVEWEPLPEWDPELGYFHATYNREQFRLDRDAFISLIEVEGSGHVVGRQMSIVTAEPLFKEFAYVMEANNEVDIDGVERVVDYLGTEDSFTFSWGFQSEFTGLRAGMPHLEVGDVNELSIYRFHDHMPIRYRERLSWEVNWREEQGLKGSVPVAAAAAAGGAMVDAAWVVYWYADQPGGYAHRPLPPAEERDYRPELDIVRQVGAMTVDPNPTNAFESAEDLARVEVHQAYPSTHPFWIDEPEARGGHPGNPNPGRRGILAVHPESGERPCYVLRKVRVPDGDPRLRVAVSGDPYEAPGRSDFLLALGIVDGGEVAWVDERVIDAGDPPSPDNWVDIEYDLAPYAGRDVGIALRVSYGGPNGIMNDEAFFDEISIVNGP